MSHHHRDTDKIILENWELVDPCITFSIVYCIRWFTKAYTYNAIEKKKEKEDKKERGGG